MSIELVSFDLCPFVQRSVITLIEKKAEYKITYIDLAKPPEWFLKISPFGKVPLLRVGEVALFESAIINEYLDETHPPSMHPSDPLQRALNRAWIEFGSDLLGAQYMLSIAPDAETYAQRLAELNSKLDRLESVLTTKPYFNGQDFSLIDCAFAPMFMRLDLLMRHQELGLYSKRPRVAAWAQALRERPSVPLSVPTDFAAKFFGYLRATHTYGGQRHG